MSAVALRARRQLREDLEAVAADVILLVVRNRIAERLAGENGRSYACQSARRTEYPQESLFRSRGTFLALSTFQRGVEAFPGILCKTLAKRNRFVFSIRRVCLDGTWSNPVIVFPFTKGRSHPVFPSMGFLVSGFPRFPRISDYSCYKCNQDRKRNVMRQ